MSDEPTLLPYAVFRVKFDWEDFKYPYFEVEATLDRVLGIGCWRWLARGIDTAIAVFSDPNKVVLVKMFVEIVDIGEATNEELLGMVQDFW